MILRIAFVAVTLVSLAVNAQRIESVDAVGITVSDMDQSLRFYTEALPFKVVSDVEVFGADAEALKALFGIRYRRVRLQLGSEFIELTDYLTAGGRKIPDDSKSNDLWFQHIAIVVSDMDAAYSLLRKSKVIHVSTGPQTLPKTIPAAEGIKAFYFRDPDGHNLELIFYPAGKGDGKWQTLKSTGLFLGIDHTAIGVRSTEASRHFYNGILGLTFQGESINFGTEQAHLNNVEGAMLHITGNKASKGMGVEFLNYLTPLTGRPYPLDSRADDLLHFETIMCTDDAVALHKKLADAGFRGLSDPIELRESLFGYQRGFYLRDPDGHVLGFFEKTKR